MFDIGWSELLLIGIVALIVIGPKELPGALRTLGQWMTKLRRMASEFQNQFQDAIREAEFAELKKEVDEMAAKASSYTQFDPIEDMRKDLEKAAGDFPSLDTPPASASTAEAASATAAEGTVASAPAVPAASDAAVEQAALPAAEPAAPSANTGVDAVVDAGKPDAGRAA